MKRLIAALLVSLLAFSGLTACRDSQATALAVHTHATAPSKAPHRGKHTRECETTKSMTDFTQLDAEAQRLIDAAVAQQKSTDDATISDLRAQLAACQAGSGGTTTPPATQPTVSATVTDAAGSSTLNWTVNNGPISGLTGWHVARDGNDANGSGPWGTDLAATATSFQFLSLVGGTTYNLSVAPIVNGTAGTAKTVQAHPTAASTGGGTTPPPTTPPATGGSNTLANGNIIGGAAKTGGSGLLPPTADAFSGYTQILTEDFDTNFPEGQLGAVLPRWDGYQGQPDGNVAGLTWDTKQVSAAGSVVTMRNSGGTAHCQAITPIFRDAANSGGSWNTQAVKYGKFSIRLKARGQQGYKIAFLLWPTDGDWNKGEIDYPEGDLISASPSEPWTMTANSHNVAGNPVDGKYKDSNVAIDDGKWHTATIDWDATGVRFYMDGVLFHNVTDPNYIPTTPMRWELQAETTPGQVLPNNTAYVDIDWVAAYKKN